MLYLTGEVDNGCELTRMEVDGDEEQHLSKTDPAQKTHSLLQCTYYFNSYLRTVRYLFPNISGGGGGEAGFCRQLETPFPHTREYFFLLLSLYGDNLGQISP